MAGGKQGGRKSVPANGGKHGVFVVEDHECVAAGIEALLRADGGFRYLGGAADLAGARAGIARVVPDVVVLDLLLGGETSLDLIGHLKGLKRPVPTVVFTMVEDVLFMEKSFAMGASGYVLKSDSWLTLREALRSAVAGRRVVSPGMGGGVGYGGLSGLSHRQMQVLLLIGSGFRNKEAARRLGISVRTIEAHREHIKSKLALDSAEELDGFARKWKQGLLGKPLVGGGAK
jgi:DNA-binding NarL/FixJ family response regulator